ncbi:PfkB family carbohydrate kinase [Nocardia mangyaensis]|uniref:PfkB family carbohydrate kinase n=1 Tax=Nocardia mangyaensis TaxID=2213200 RepID=UPI0026766DCF|nr:PfkB family carbohydrate kinase [Nocardia mangyaensis]MDO3646364.1 PfkB family carbohydrate kinase [Nocardia mangyaensis]
MVPQDPRTDVVRGILARLGKFAGLSADRLRHTEIDVESLLDLPVVARHAERSGVPREDAILPVLRDQARQLPPAELLIVDAILALGLLRDSTTTDIDPERLYAVVLGARREYLAEHWTALHAAIGAEPAIEAPTVKRLRTYSEHAALTALAAALSAEPRTPTHPPVPPSAASRGATVTVVGDAVIDHIYRVDTFPADQSPVAASFVGAPGGKGLNRAVAAAVLGLDVHLIAAIGRDADGARVLDLLTDSGVRTDLVRIRPDAPTLVTAVIMNPGGEVRLIGCHDPRVQLSEEDLRSPDIHAALADSAVVVLTFERSSIVEQVLALIRELPERPRVIVCPTPSMAVPQGLYLYLDVVDYLVGTTVELDALLPEVHTASSADTAIRLRGLGVSTVCAVDGFRCTVYSDDVDIVIDHFPRVLKASAGAAAAFAGALAYRVITTDGALTAADFEFATAAMVPTQKLVAFSDSLPRRAEIERIVALHAPEGGDTRNIGATGR